MSVLLQKKIICHGALDKNKKLNQHVLHGVEERDRKARGRDLSTQRESKLSLLDTQYNDCSGQLMGFQHNPPTMQSTVDHFEQENKQLSRELGA